MVPEDVEDLTQAELSELANSVGMDDQLQQLSKEEISEGRQEMVIDIEASPPHELADIVAGSRTPETMSYGSGEASGVASPNRHGGERCWASLFDHDCLRLSEGGGEKLIDKFCSVCRATGVRVAAKRVRALSPEQYERFANSRKEGFWTEGSSGTPRFRVVNHTKECQGSWLVLFEKEPVGVPVNWAPMPPEWLESPEHMRLWLSKSTMVPRQPRQKLKRKGSSAGAHAPVPPPLRPLSAPPPMSSPLGPQPHHEPHLTPLLDELLLGNSAHGVQEVEADFVRQYRAAHDAVRGLIEARLARTELPLATEQREALLEQLHLSSAHTLLMSPAPRPASPGRPLLRPASPGRPPPRAAPRAGSRPAPGRPVGIPLASF